MSSYDVVMMWIFTVIQYFTEFLNCTISSQGEHILNNYMLVIKTDLSLRRRTL